MPFSFCSWTEQPIFFNKGGMFMTKCHKRRAASQDTNAIVKLKQDEIELTRKVPLGGS